MLSCWTKELSTILRKFPRAQSILINDKHIENINTREKTRQQVNQTNIIQNEQIF
jgi:hypothetical protein